MLSFLDSCKWVNLSEKCKKRSSWKKCFRIKILRGYQQSHMVIILKKKFFSQINLKGFIAITCKPLIEKIWKMIALQLSGMTFLQKSSFMEFFSVAASVIVELTFIWLIYLVYILKNSYFDRTTSAADCWVIYH